MKEDDKPGCGYGIFKIQDKDNEAFCRRFPPAILLNVHLPQNFISTFADCSSTDWCGEWRKKEDEENE